jgi:hypothetical protein
MDTENTHQEDNEQSNVRGKSKRKVIWLITGLVAIVVLAIIIFLAWLYTGQLNDLKTNVFKRIPLPAVAVDTSLIPAQDIFRRFQVAEDVLGPEQASARKTELQNQILERLIADAQAEIQARKLKISISEPEVTDQYNRLVEQLAGGSESEFETAVKENYRLSLDEFKSEIIRPDIMQSKMQIWFNEQKDLNTDIFKKTDEIQSKLSNGEAFGELAKQYSDDEGTKNLEGDAGTIAISDMLPEFQEVLKTAKTGDVKQATSRYGQHIIKVIDRDVSEGEDNAKLHVQQIFIKQDGFAKWYDEQIKTIKVYNFLKFKV